MYRNKYTLNRSKKQALIFLISLAFIFSTPTLSQNYHPVLNDENGWPNMGGYLPNVAPPPGAAAGTSNPQHLPLLNPSEADRYDVSMPPIVGGMGAQVGRPPENDGLIPLPPAGIRTVYRAVCAQNDEGGPGFEAPARVLDQGRGMRPRMTGPGTLFSLYHLAAGAGGVVPPSDQDSDSDDEGGGWVRRQMGFFSATWDLNTAVRYASEYCVNSGSYIYAISVGGQNNADGQSVNFVDSNSALRQYAYQPLEREVGIAGRVPASQIQGYWHVPPRNAAEEMMISDFTPNAQYNPQSFQAGTLHTNAYWLAGFPNEHPALQDEPWSGTCTSGLTYDPSGSEGDSSHGSQSDPEGELKKRSAINVPECQAKIGDRLLGRQYSNEIDGFLIQNSSKTDVWPVVVETPDGQRYAPVQWGGKRVDAHAAIFTHSPAAFNTIQPKKTAYIPLNALYNVETGNLLPEGSSVRLVMRGGTSTHISNPRNYFKYKKNTNTKISYRLSGDTFHIKASAPRIEHMILPADVELGVARRNKRELFNSRR